VNQVRVVNMRDTPCGRTFKGGNALERGRSSDALRGIQPGGYEKYSRAVPPPTSAKSEKDEAAPTNYFGDGVETGNRAAAL
jgi:hypothetical protein